MPPIGPIATTRQRTADRRGRRRARGFPRPRGFTMVELLIGAALSAALMAAVLSTYVLLGRNLARLLNQQSLEAEARRTLDYFASDVRIARDLYGTPSASSVALTTSAAGGANVVTYYYNSGSDDTTVAVNGTNVTMPGNSLTRCVYDGTTVNAATVLHNITSSGFSVQYFDALGRSYASYTDYRAGIKQLALQFSTQTGTAAIGTQTPVYQVASSRMTLRNRPLTR